MRSSSEPRQHLFRWQALAQPLSQPQLGSQAASQPQPGSQATSQPQPGSAQPLSQQPLLPQQFFLRQPISMSSKGRRQRFLGAQQAVSQQGSQAASQPQPGSAQPLSQQLLSQQLFLHRPQRSKSSKGVLRHLGLQGAHAVSQQGSQAASQPQPGSAHIVSQQLALAAQPL
jgi:hypothetical protein